MKITVRNGKDGEWRRVPNSDERWDDSLQALIHQIPELISVEDLGPGRPGMKVCITNASASSEDDGGLIGIDDTGGITIVECETADDPTNSRKIVGQALEYAAALWEMPYEEFDDMVLVSEGRSLVELMREKTSSEEWSAETFKAAVASSLHQGRFRLMMVTQKMTDELQRTIKFLNKRGQFFFEIYAVEILRFLDGETEIIIPRITVFANIQEKDSTQIAASTSKTTAPASRTAATTSKAGPPPAEPIIAVSEKQRQADPKESAAEQKDKFPKSDKSKEELFFARCEETVSQNAMEMIRKLYEFSMEMADSMIWWGPGGAGAFNFVLTENQLTVFIVDVNGKIMFNFSEWQREPAYKNLLAQFLEKLKGVSTLRQQKGGYAKWPDFDVEEFFSDEDDLEKFQQAVEFLKGELVKPASV